MAEKNNYQIIWEKIVCDKVDENPYKKKLLSVRFDEDGIPLSDKYYSFTVKHFRSLLKMYEKTSGISLL